MASNQIQAWLSYWASAKMVAVENILAFEHVYQARKFCECMRMGVFADVTDLAIWRALVEMRAAAAAKARAA